MNPKDCKYWNHLKKVLKKNSVVYITKNDFRYRFVEFTTNRTGAEVLKYAIPNRAGTGVNHKSIPNYVICAAYEDNQKGFTINRQWMKIHFLDVDNAGGCNVKVVEYLLEKYPL